MCVIHGFEADFLWKVSLKILNSGIILKTFTHAGWFEHDLVANPKDRPRGYKTFFVLISAEHEISTAHKN